MENFAASALMRPIAAWLARPVLTQVGVLSVFVGPPHSNRSLARAMGTRPADDRVRCRADGSGSGQYV